MDSKEHWPKFKRAFVPGLVLSALVAGVGTMAAWGPLALLWLQGTVLCLALGFWLTQLLMSVLTGRKKANSSAIGLLLFGKITWWVCLFMLAKSLPPGMEKPAALGTVAFLVALLIGAGATLGMPRISDEIPGKQP